MRYYKINNDLKIGWFKTKFYCSKMSLTDDTCIYNYATKSIYFYKAGIESLNNSKGPAVITDNRYYAHKEFWFNNKLIGFNTEDSYDYQSHESFLSNKEWRKYLKLLAFQ